MSGLFLISYIALWILVLLIAGLQLTILHNLGAIYQQFPKLRPAPSKLKMEDNLPALNVQETGSDQMRMTTEFKGAKTAFSIVSPHCGPCIEYLRQVASDNADPDPLDPSVRDRVVIGIGEPDEIRRLIKRVQLPPEVPVFIDSTRQVINVWGITATPATVIVDDDHKVVRQVFNS